MPSKAFNARRVTESFESINSYLEQAVAIAGGIPPGQIAKQTLVTVPGTVSPRLTNVVWELGSGTPSSIPLDDVKDGVKVVITAANLSHQESGAWVTDIRVFKLVGLGAGTTYLEAAASQIKQLNQTDSTATLHLVPGSPSLPPVGLYDAFVVHKSGQTSLLPDACEVLKPTYSSGRGGQTGTTGGPQGSGSAAAFKLQGIVPNSGAPHSTIEASLILSRGASSDVDHVTVTDANGKAMNWQVRIVEAKDAPQAARAMHGYKPQKLVYVEITIPKDEKPGQYFLVARGKSPNAEETASFFVV